MDAEAGATGEVTRSPEAWERYATGLFTAAGLEADKAASTARLLVLTDMMGRRTHGLAQCAAYLDELSSGGMTKTGSWEVVRDTGSTLLWDGRYLPGLWLVDEAIGIALERAKEHGVVTVAMAHGHHIGCLAALVKRAADAGCFCLLASSGPQTQFVAPHGGKRGLFSPNPFAVGYPAGAAPVLFDACASLTTVSMTREKVAAGEQFEHPWLLDPEGRPTRDPSVMERSENRGSLLLLGGEEAGHKGFGLALMIEALTQGLSGFGRREAPTRWGSNVFLQVIDPDAFAGRDAFVAQTAFFADECRANPPIDPSRPVRLPGDSADRAIRRSREAGVALPARTVAAMAEWQRRLSASALAEA